MYFFTTQSGHCVMIAVLSKYWEKSMCLEDSLVHHLNFQLNEWQRSWLVFAIRQCMYSGWNRLTKFIYANNQSTAERIKNAGSKCCYVKIRNEMKFTHFDKDYILPYTKVVGLIIGDYLLIDCNSNFSCNCYYCFGDYSW